MLRAEAQPGAADGADDQRRLDLAARHEAVLGDRVDDLVEADAEEIGEHDLGDRPVAGDGEAERGADEAGLGDRRVADAGGAELLVEPLAGLERPAGRADVLAHDEDLVVPPHLLLERGEDRFAVGDLLHRCPQAKVRAWKSMPSPGHGEVAARSEAARGRGPLLDDDLLGLGAGEELPLDQRRLVELERIAGEPGLDLLRVAILGRVGARVAAVAVGHAFDEGRAAAGAGAVRRLGSGFVDRLDVVAVDLHRRHLVAAWRA